MIDKVLNNIREGLHSNFSNVFDWLKVDERLLVYRPVSGGWNIAEILEHISLTNHYLLLLISKATRKAIEKSKKADYVSLLDNYDLDWDKMHAIGEPGSFSWTRPGHMVPSGNVSLEEIRNRLQQQLTECLSCLDQLRNGEGVLYTTMMSVNNLGKIDVYHYIYFVAQHARRHIKQMEMVEMEFDNKHGKLF